MSDQIAGDDRSKTVGAAGIWIGRLFVVLGALGAVAVVAVSAQGEWLSAAKGAAMTLIFVLAAAMNLRSPDGSSRPAQIRMLFAGVGWVALEAVDLY